MWGQRALELVHRLLTGLCRKKVGDHWSKLHCLDCNIFNLLFKKNEEIMNLGVGLSKYPDFKMIMARLQRKK